MMGVDPNFATLIAVGCLVTVIDKQDRIGVRERLSDHSYLGAPISFATKSLALPAPSSGVNPTGC